MSESTDNGTNSELFVEMLEKVTQKKKKKLKANFMNIECVYLYIKRNISMEFELREFFLSQWKIIKKHLSNEADNVSTSSIIERLIVLLQD